MNSTLVMILLFVTGLLIGFELGRAYAKKAIMSFTTEFLKGLSNGRKPNEKTDIQVNESQQRENR